MVVTRRNMLQWIGVAAMDLGLPAMASPTARCKVIGVGDAGCNIVLASWPDISLQRLDCNVEFSCIFTGQQTFEAVTRFNRAKPEAKPIGILQLATFGTGGNVNDAVSAANAHHYDLLAQTIDTDMVILVTGLGGGTGTVVAPMLAAMAQQSGAAAYAVVVTPWLWELGRYPLAFDAIKKLHRSCDYMVALSNEAAGNGLGDTATLEDVIKQQELEAGESIQMLLKLGTRFIKERGKSSA